MTKFSLFLALLFVSAVATAQDRTYAPTTPIATLGDATLTLQDIDAMALQLPEDVRAGVFDSPKRIGNTLETMLVRRAMVSPVLAAPPAYLDLERLTAEARRQILITLALKNAINAIPTPDFAAQARDYYQAHPDEFVTPATVSVRHVLIGSNGRSPADAFRLANKVHQQLVTGELSFDQAVEKFSEDPARAQNSGRYSKITPGMMVPAFEAASYSLSSIGEISKPVRTQYGYHIIVLEEQHPPEPQSESASVAALEAGYFQEFLRTRKPKFIASLGGDPEQRLMDLAVSQRVADSPEFDIGVQLTLEEAVLGVYKQHYLEKNVPGDFDAVAKEYYLTHRDEFQRPAAVTAVQVEIPKTDHPDLDNADLHWLREIAKTPVGAQILIALTPESAFAQQVTYIEGVAETGRATRIAMSLKAPGDCSETTPLANSYFFICLIRKHPVLHRSFVETRKPLIARFRSQQEGKVWNLHVNEFHQLPFFADELVVASLRTRYAQTDNAN